MGEIDQERNDLAAQQFAFYSSELTADNPYSKTNDAALVGQVRTYLNKFSGLQRLYTSMLTDARQKAKNYRFAAAHPEGLDVLRARADVDAAFTSDGWKIMDQSIQHPNARHRAKLGFSGTATSTNLTAADLSEQLRAMYEKDFIAAVARVFKCHIGPALCQRSRRRFKTVEALLELLAAPRPPLRRCGQYQRAIHRH